ncbi:MAG: DEAD/DEAH box helicase [Bacteroidetes bacterium]|nr:DEAD/DEAH box helicase [Bacteroidota bacterium]
MNRVPDNKIDDFPIEWGQFVDRDSFITEFAGVSAVPSIVVDSLPSIYGYMGDDELQRRWKKFYSQTAYLLKKDRVFDSNTDIHNSRFVASILTKILTRGHTPFPTLGIEQEAIDFHGFSDLVKELDEEDALIGWDSNLNLDPQSILNASLNRIPFVLDPEFDFVNHLEKLKGNEAEAKFLSEWIPENLGQDLGHWFIPQGNRDLRIKSHGNSGYNTSSSQRCVNFLFCHPLLENHLIIEIDGEQHQTSFEIDQQRDRSLQSVDFEVIRISTHELEFNHGHSLSQLKERLKSLHTPPTVSEMNQKIAGLILSCSSAAKVQYAIVDALWRGWLRPGKDWEIILHNASSPHKVGVDDLLEMLKEIEVIYGIQASPSSCSIKIYDTETNGYLNSGQNQVQLDNGKNSLKDYVKISIELNRGPFHTTINEHDFDCIIRSAYLPINLAVSPKLTRGEYRASRTQDDGMSSRQEKAIRFFLQQIFRKREFREGQFEGIINALRKVDSIILLPTGGGKSIIYQLAGMLMPGITLVVDPIIALMEDQVEGLQSYGIDRAIAIFSTSRSARKYKQQLIEKGQYYYVLISPERLQSIEFRETIHTLSEDIPINLTVIDEAHCVSEWGHDFRPAYLSLSNTLRGFVSINPNAKPPLMALTGTASRAVLRDVVNDLEIDKNNSDSIIRPHSFDRTEIKFRVFNTIPNFSPSILKKELNRKPKEHGISISNYYGPKGKKTNSIIIFIPKVGGKHGIDDTYELVKEVIPENWITIYSGKAPKSMENFDWDVIKSQNARNFKQNHISVLVATKSFGMGIDKPNIRATIHVGIPSSIEQYYQEAGRAGRDKLDATSTLILGEFDSERSDQWLDPRLDLEDIRTKHYAMPRFHESDDDITRALYFHLLNFKGIDDEVRSIENLIRHIIDHHQSGHTVYPFKSDSNRREKSIYRLYKLGVITDYTVNWGKKEFRITTKRSRFDQYRENFLNYVKNVAPGKLKFYYNKAQEIDLTDRIRSLIDLAEIFIEFTYDEIERARRRAIHESILLARESETDSDIRKRILDYLQEGMGYEKIEELLSKEDVNLNEWIDLAENFQGPIEAGELRGLCIRALESHSDHPGLLIVRGLSETWNADYRWNTAYSNISRAFMVGIEKYSITQEHIEEVVKRLIDLKNKFSENSSSIQHGPDQFEQCLARSLLDVAEGDSSQLFEETILARLFMQSKIPCVIVLLDWYRLHFIVNHLEESAIAICDDFQNINSL